MCKQPLQVSDTANFDSNHFPKWLYWLESCPSTNTWAIEHADRLHPGAVVFTRQQTAGRGQHGRIWHSPFGVLTASFVLDDLPASRLSGLSLALGLAVIYAVEELLPETRGKLRLKWPNDVLIEERKLAGILAEATSGSHSGRSRVVVGVGLNRCADFAQAGFTSAQIGYAISLHQVSSSVPDELSLLDKLRHHLMQVCDKLTQADDLHGIATFLPELHQRDILFGRQVALGIAGEQVLGQAVGIDASGRLLLQLPNNQIRAFVSGRVSMG